MKIRVLGCYGGRLLGYHLSSFLVNGTILLDAGSPTIVLSLEEQWLIRHIFVSHTHLDHISDIAFLADNRSIKRMGEKSRDNNIVIHSLPDNINTLKKDFLNNRIWPDFTHIPLNGKPILTMRPFEAEEVIHVEGVSITPIVVNHPVPCTAFLLSQNGVQFIYSADTGITDRLWAVANAQPNLQGIILDCSFPNAYKRLADVSGHLIPHDMGIELKKLDRLGEIPIYLFHIKPETMDVILEEIKAENIPKLTILHQEQVISI
ncbi:MAG: 3',5'-cyclic-nucleotide phosphodiesterase [Mariprofundaceae bacterium]|nr:3',5'-cyclic-nucleotide phosphodiesterase [Mariprofundaceae bacterium]